MGTDDLAPLLMPEAQPLQYAQGVIKSWHPDTFENVVDVHGNDLENLPVKSSVEALTYQEGDTVILARWPSSRGGTGTWWIDGRAVIPGTGRGEEAIAFMTTTLGAAVAKSVIASSIFSAVNDGNQDVNYPSGGFVDPDSGTPGPTIADVEIGDSGRALVQLDSAIFPNEPTSGAVSAQFGVSVSGATTLLANPDRAISMVQFAGVGTIACQCAGTILLTDLNPGLHTFTGKYLADVISGTPPASARFNDPTITVTAF